MAAPTVYMSEIDLSTRVPAFAGVYGAIVIPTNKGQLEPRLVTSDTDLLRNFTVNETVPIDGNVAYFSALAFLEKSGKLWVKRCPGSGYLYGGIDVNPTGTESDIGTATPWGVGTATPKEKAFGSQKCFIYGADPGVWNSDIKIKVFRHREKEEIVADSVADYGNTTTHKFNIYPNVEVSAEAVLTSTDWQTGEPVRVAQPLAVRDTATGEIVKTYNLPVGLNGNDTYYLYKDSEVKSGANEWSSTVKFYSSYAAAKEETGANPLSLDARKEEITISAWTSEMKFVVGSEPSLGWQTGDPVFIKAKAQEAVLPTVFSDKMGLGHCVFIINLGKQLVGAVYKDCIQFAATKREALEGTPIASFAFPSGTEAEDQAKVFDVVECIGLTLIPTKDTNVPNTCLLEVFKGEDEVNPIESWVFSRKEGTKDLNGKNIFIDNLLNASLYVRGRSNKSITSPDDKWTAGATPAGAVAVQAVAVALAGGANGSVVTEADMVNSLQCFRSKESYPITCLMDGGYTEISYQKEILKIAETRYDCIGYLNSRLEDELSASYLNNVVSYKSSQLNPNSSYGGMFSPHAIILDRFNNVDRQVPIEGFCAANFAATAYNQETWYPVGGNTRGVLNVKDLVRRYSEGERSYLYDNGINPIRFKLNKGIAIWGQKTLSARPSKLDRLNVRGLLIVIKPAIEEALEDFLFELNDDATRVRVASVLNTYLEGIKNRRGIGAFEVKCDTDNNSNSDIDNYLMNVWVFVSPTTAVEYVKCPLIITSTGASFADAAMSL